jgi:hypothetical protein
VTKASGSGCQVTAVYDVIANRVPVTIEMDTP